MGYRSDVAIVFTKKLFWKYVGENIKYFKDCDVIKQDKNTVTFFWESVKWYDTYEDVQGIIAIMYKIAYKEGEEHYGYIRIGEDPKDIESLGSPWRYNLFTMTSISEGIGEDTEKDEFFAPNSIKFIKEE